MGFKTINGRKVFIDDNSRRASSNGRNDESEGMSIGNGTRVPQITTEIPSPDPHEGGQAVLDTLSSSISDVGNKKFFEKTGIEKFVLFGRDEIIFADLPKNPNDVEKMIVRINRATDEFEAVFFVENQFTPALTEKEIPVTLLSQVLIHGLGFDQNLKKHY